jgi:hypothetical protein
MNITDLAQHMLPLLRAKSPPSPPVARIEVTEGYDSTGDPSLYFWLLFPDSVKAEQMTLDTILPLQKTVRDEVRRLGETRWPYVRFQRESEYEKMSRGEV